MIPARFKSSRFPGKPLAKLGDKTLVQSTYENALRAHCFDTIIIATDNQEIYHHANSFGAEAVLTSEHCQSGTDRIIDLLNQGHQENASIVVNLQGDEPFLEPQVVNGVIEALRSTPDAVVATAIVEIEDEIEARNPSVVKCVCDQHGRALYFSRSLIPGNKNGNFKPPYYKHLGIYAYQREFLLKFGQLPPTPLQQAEDLEQLKILEHGFPIHTVVVQSESIGIDTPEDLERAKERLSGTHP